MDLAIIIIAGLFGLCFGSYGNVVIYRVPRNLSTVKPSSFCPSCDRRLRFFDLIPVFSQLIFLGKCRTCKAKISLRYPLVELLCGLLFAAMAFYSPTLSIVPLAVLSFVLLTITFIDIDIQEIPDGLVILGAVAGIFWVVGGHFFAEYFPTAPTWSAALIGAIAGGVPLLVIDRICLAVLKKDGFGYGDVKLMAMVGIFLGWEMTLLAFLFSFFTGAIFAVYLMVTGKAKRGAYMAFGPFLVIGTLLAFWFGWAILDWYFAMMYV